MIYSSYIKVYGDQLIAGILGILLLPLFVLIFILLLVTQGKPICFVQRRSGIYQRTFKLYKFRTLNPSHIEDLGMGSRVFTSFGYFMRRYGIDELPQLLNIIKGEMSFIGPRPMPIEYDSKYNQIQIKRFNVKPGITGWAQVHGRNNISWVRRFELDQWYANNVSLCMDIKITRMTFVQIIRSAFNKDKKHVEMPVFTGSN